MRVLIKLKDISEIITGYTFRGAIEQNKNGDAFVMQAKDIIQDENLINTSDLTKISLISLRSSAFIKENDIVMISRGMGPGAFRAIVIRFKEESVIASSSIQIIRITDPTIIPEYVASYLNSPDGQNTLFKNVSGSHIKTILRKDLEEIKIPLPSIDKQKTIVAFHDNIRRQEEILKQKSEIINKLYNSTFRNIITI